MPLLSLVMAATAASTPAPAADAATLAAIEATCLDYIDGQPLTHLPHLSRTVIEGFGELCGQMSHALAGFEHPGLERTLQWDPRHAQALITHLLATLPYLPQRAALFRSGHARGCARSPGFGVDRRRRAPARFGRNA